MFELTTLPAALAFGGLLVGAALAASPGANPAERHRYLVERTFPAGALDGLDAAAKERVHAANATVDVRWVHSYANADRTKTFCVYEGPSEAAVRAAAAKNALPVDRIVEVPVDLEPGPLPPIASSNARHRYVVERTFPEGALAGLDDATRRAVNARNAELGVKWVGSYANAAKTRTFCIYEGPSEAAVREAAAKNALPIDRIVEVPVDLEPR